MEVLNVINQILVLVVAVITGFIGTMRLLRDDDNLGLLFIGLAIVLLKLP